MGMEDEGAKNEGGGREEGGAPVFRLERLRIAADGDTAFMKELAEIFLQDVGRRMERLEGMAASGDWEGGVLEAHTIKGSCANVGVMRMQAAAEALEDAVKEGDEKGAVELRRSLAGEFVRVRAVFTRYLAGE